MNKRINIVLPTATVAVLDSLAAKGQRSKLIDRAVRHYIKSHSRRNLREGLKREALANSARDLEIATEWFSLEEEAWDLAQVPKKKK